MLQGRWRRATKLRSAESGRRTNTGKRKHRLTMTPEGQRNHDAALSPSKGGPRAPSVLRQAQHGVGTLGRQGRTALVNALARWCEMGIFFASRAERERDARLKETQRAQAAAADP